MTVDEFFAHLTGNTQSTLMQLLFSFDRGIASQLSCCKLSLFNSFTNSRFSTLINLFNSHANSRFSTLMQTFASQLSSTLINSHANSRFSTLINSHANSRFLTLMQTLASQLSSTLTSQLSRKLSLLNSHPRLVTFV